MAANLVAPQITSNSVLFANKEQANAFFAACEIPSATTTEEGVVKQAEIVIYNQQEVSGAAQEIIPIMQGDGTIYNASMVKYANYADLLQKFQTLQTAMTELIAKLRNAGIME